MRAAKTQIRLDAQSDLNFRWAHGSFCLFCRAAAQILFSLLLLFFPFVTYETICQNVKKQNSKTRILRTVKVLTT